MFLSIIIPFYNEDKVARQVIEDHVRQAGMLEGLTQWEIVCLDDASQDDTWRVLLTAAKDHHTVRVIHNDRNRGIVMTFSRLFTEAKGTHIYLTGGDGQWPAENLGALYRKWQKTGDDLIIGVRQGRCLVYGPWRTVLSYGFNTLGFLMTGFNGRDINGIKLGRQEIFAAPVQSRSFFAEIERIRWALRSGYRISHAPAVFCKRVQGKATGAQWNNVRDTLRDLKEHYGRH